MSAQVTIGVLGAAEDAQCSALRAELEDRGARVVLVESQGLNRGERCAIDDCGFTYGGVRLDLVDAWFLRYVMSPLPPSFQQDERYHLFDDWFVSYMHRRERAGLQLSWLLELGRRGVPLINPPQHGSVMQLKPFQLQAARAAGLSVPRSLVTNDPARARAFCAEVGEAVYKPSLGGGPCCLLDAAALERLDQITAAPVTFQERIRGTPVRLTVLGGSVISAAAIESEVLDHRTDPAYRSGAAPYREIEVPAALAAPLRALLLDCGLLLAGVDFMVDQEGAWRFLEANPAPVYLDVEQRLGHRITAALAAYLLQLAGAPEDQRARLAEAARSRSFVAYALPFDPERLVR